MYSCSCDKCIFVFSEPFVACGYGAEILPAQVFMQRPRSLEVFWEFILQPPNCSYEGTSFKNFTSFLAQFLVVYVGLLASQEQGEAFCWMRCNITVHLTSSGRKMGYSGATKVHFMVAISIYRTQTFKQLRASKSSLNLRNY